MFGRTRTIVMVEVERSGRPGMVPLDNPNTPPTAYPDFFDTLWYVRRLKEWAQGGDAHREPPVLYWLSPVSRDRLLAEKGKRDVSVWLAVLGQTIRRFEDVERDLQAGDVYDTASWLDLKNACIHLWTGLDIWLPSGE